MKKILLAIGHPNFSEYIKKYILQHRDKFSIQGNDVLQYKFLEESLEVHKPDILLIHEYYLLKEEDKESRDKIWFNYLKQLKIKEPHLRVVVLCERDDTDSFLSNLVATGVCDIFNQNNIDCHDLIQQMIHPPSFSNVANFLKSPIDSTKLPQSDLISTETENSDIAEEVEEVTHKEEDVEKTREPKKPGKKTTIQIKIEKENNPEPTKLHLDNKLILVGSNTEKSGSTFIAHQLAKTLSMRDIRVTYIENPLSFPYTYDRFAGHLVTNNYRSQFYKHSGGLFSTDTTYEWIHEDIEIICKHPSETILPESLTTETLFKVLMGLKTKITIIDIGSDWDNDFTRSLFDNADLILNVVSPDVTHLQKLLESGPFNNICEEVYLYGNRFTEQVYDSELLVKNFKKYLIGYYPDEDPSDIFQAQIDRTFMEPNFMALDPILKLVDPELTKLPQKISMKKRFKNLFRNKITINKTEIMEARNEEIQSKN
ncbi:hypothetical protein [Bacillus altitudinis]|uniref:hypothetical protein n=1 Tax=Bacillus altitudinis TaxID=293387 RepID=UPI0022814A6A|nr:hypothetical protein [Bacillus altitudinis]MCY7454238.1 hypothetical protein [Bacillus altitudinis]